MRRLILAGIVAVLGLVATGVQLTRSVSATTLTLVARGATWRYLDTGVDPGGSWRTNGFNDSAWRSGPAQLGYGDGGEATIVSYGSSASNKFITTYFRYRFTVADPANYQGLTLRLLRDDGAVVYLNEVEIARSNLPAGAVTQATRATTAVGGADEQAWFSFTVNPGRLVTGSNVLAVEIHQSDPTSSDISFDLELTAASGASLTRGPYLQLGTPRSMAIRWRTDAATSSRVTYGPDPANLIWTADDAVSTTEHQVALSNLLPDTRYYYAVGSTSEMLAGGDGTYTFVTSPLPGATKPTRVWVVGDSGTGDSNAAAVRDSYTAFTGTRDTDLWLMLGDNAYESGLDAEYQRGVFDMYPAMLRRSVLWPTLGNHDGQSADSTTGTGPYYDAFTLPRGGEAGGVASGTEAYYSFDYGAVHFVCLDSYDSSRSANGAMATWLRQDLASTTARWVVAYWHHPPYSKGSHNSDTEIELVEMRANINPILEAGGVDLVLAGHSHSYERSFLIDGHYGVSTTFSNAMKKDGGSGRGSSGTPYRKSSLDPAPHQGTVYAVAGVSAKTGGGTLNHPAMFVSLNVLGSMVLDVNGNRLDARFIDVAGGVRDEFTLIKGQSGTAPQPPAGLTATATSTNTIDLRWSDSDNLEEGFKVERATGGGAFAEVVTLGANVTSYTDAGRSPSTTYSYRIRAFNAAAFSAFSAVATATTPAPPPPPAQTVFIAVGSTWKYLDTGSNQGTAWRATAFNDSSWRSGPAQLGYGDGDEATVVRYGSSSNKYITTYFRRSFSVANRAAFSALTLRLMRDDGAVVYLNGVEVFRTNMPAGTIGYSTRASSAVGGSDESRFFTASVSPTRLVNGTNVMAVEIHQSDPTSSDVSFNLDLTGR